MHRKTGMVGEKEKLRVVKRCGEDGIIVGFVGGLCVLSVLDGHSTASPALLSPNVGTSSQPIFSSSFHAHRQHPKCRPHTTHAALTCLILILTFLVFSHTGSLLVQQIFPS